MPGAEAADHQRAGQPTDRDGHAQVCYNQRGLFMPLRRGEPVSGAGVDEDGVPLGERLRLERHFKRELALQHQCPQRPRRFGEHRARRQPDMVHPRHLPRRFRRGGADVVYP
ncbi:hypothetical protein GCM10009735_15970 [Actinomadura chokoriensis]